MSGHSPPDATDANMTADAPRTQVMQTFEQLLEQCDPDEIPDMVARLKAKLARHRQTLNSQQSLLLTKLPTELIMEVCEHILGEPSLKSNKAWFHRVLPLLQTCVQLRAQFRPLLSTPLICEVNTSTHQMEAEALAGLAKWRKDGSHQGRVILIVNTVSGQALKLGTAATIAGNLERTIYGSLLHEPAVYVGCTRVFVRSGTGGGAYYVSHCREKNMLGESRNYWKGSSLNFRYVYQWEANEGWVKARKEGKID